MLNGNLDMVKEIQTNGGEARYATVWWGPWSTSESMTRDLGRITSVGVTPHIQLFYFGDEICAEIVRGDITLNDYGGQPQNRKSFWEFVAMINKTINDSGRPSVLINIETEWNKKGPNTPSLTHSVLDDVGSFDDLWSRAAWTLKNGCGAKIVTAPGNWGNVVDTLKKFPKMLAVSDYVATQCLRSLPRNGAQSYNNGVSNLISTLNAMKTTFNKPLMVTDCAFSSYGGAFNSMHPFDGGDGRGAENEQTKAITEMNELKNIGVEAVFYRGLKDVPTFDVKNYHGHAERHWGVVRSDGSKKPAYNALMSLIKRRFVTYEEYTNLQMKLQETQTKIKNAIDELNASLR